MLVSSYIEKELGVENMKKAEQIRKILRKNILLLCVILLLTLLAIKWHDPDFFKSSIPTSIFLQKV